MEGRGWCAVCGSYCALCVLMMILDSFFNRHALQEYILFAGQHPAGGLRDKPPKYVWLF
jgi:prenyltransferase beta subunit